MSFSIGTIGVVTPCCHDDDDDGDDDDDDAVDSSWAFLELRKHLGTTSLDTLVGTLYVHAPLALLNVGCEKTMALS